MASFYQACCIFHIISISFNFSDTALTVAKAMIGAKVTIFFFAMFALFLKFAPELVARIFGLFSSLTPGSKSSYEPRGIGNWSQKADQPVQPG